MHSPRRKEGREERVDWTMASSFGDPHRVHVRVHAIFDHGKPRRPTKRSHLYTISTQANSSHTTHIRFIWHMTTTVSLTHPYHPIPSHPIPSTLARSSVHTYVPPPFRLSYVVCRFRFQILSFLWVTM